MRSQQLYLATDNLKCLIFQDAHMNTFPFFPLSFPPFRNYCSW